MHKDEEFSIEESTLNKLLTLKQKDGFEKKSWDDWFGYKFNFYNSEKKIEQILQESHHKNHFDEWVSNFACNLNNIWKDISAKDITSTINDNTEQRAIVIGRGPSLQKHNHLDVLAQSNFNGTIICTDGILIKALKSGVTPDKFPQFYVVTIDADEKIIRDFYDDDIVDKYGSKISGIFSTFSHPSVVERARTAGIKIYWLHTLFDYDEGQKSFNRISALMVRAKKSRGLPAIQTGGNVGTAAWFIAWQILKCNTIALIGINHSWDEDNSWETIMSHGNQFTPPKIKDDKIFDKLFPKIYNPEFGNTCILDPVFQYYSSALKEFISRSPSFINTINATEGGCIFGKRITCMKFKEFLNKFG